MEFKIELNVNGEKIEKKGNSGLIEITETGDSMIKKAIKESE